MEQKFKNLDSDQKWEAHFNWLASKSKYNHTSDEAKKFQNASLNRYINIIPFDRSRVKLQRSDSINYINANLVTVPKAARQYILTQGPLETTISHFWLMVWEQKSSVIVMLNKCIELENFVKCEEYWPKRIGDTDVYDNVKLSVTMKGIQNFKHYTMRKMLLADKISEKTRTILQFQYTAWPDHGQPESPTSLLRLITAVRKAGGLYKMDEPTVVHCSAGVGRSGTFCLIDSILSMVESQGSTEGIDIDTILLEMREYRMGLIQSPVQLRFAYTAIIYGVNILERANKLHHHLSIYQDNIAFDNGSGNGSQRANGNSTEESAAAKQTNGKKSRRRNKKNTKSNNNTRSLNIFEKNLLAEALSDIESDTADELFEQAMKPWPNMKKARNSTTSEFSSPSSRDQAISSPEMGLETKEITAETKAQMLDRAINNLLTYTNNNKSDIATPEHSDSALLRRRERDIKNQRLAERTQEMVKKMQEAKARRESQWNLLKRPTLLGSFAALVLSSAVYMYLRSSS